MALPTGLNRNIVGGKQTTMREEIQRKITLMKERMETMEPGSVQFEQYRLMVSDLEKEVKEVKIVAHETPEVCESCQ